MIQTRRNFLRGVGALLAAPAIVRASSLMAVSPLPLTEATVLDTLGEGYMARYRYVSMALGYAITREALEDNLVSPPEVILHKRLVASFQQAKDQMAAEIFAIGSDATA